MRVAQFAVLHCSAPPPLETLRDNRHTLPAYLSSGAPKAKTTATHWVLLTDAALYVIETRKAGGAADGKDEKQKGGAASKRAAGVATKVTGVSVFRCTCEYLFIMVEGHAWTHAGPRIDAQTKNLSS